MCAYWRDLRFLVECKTKTKVTSLANNQSKQINQWTNQNYKEIHVVSSRGGSEWDTICFDCSSDWMSKSRELFLSQSLSAVEQNKIKCELLSPLTWKRPVLCLHTKKRKSSQVACKLLHHAWGYLVFKELHSPFAVIKLHIIWLIYSFYKFNTSVFFPFGDRILKQPANFATFSWKAKRKNKKLKSRST